MKVLIVTMLHCYNVTKLGGLVQHHNYYDSDYAGAYSIKEYNSSKSYDQFGNWQHEKIEFLPLNKDYNPIVIDELENEDFRVIGEFVGLID